MKKTLPLLLFLLAFTSIQCDFTPDWTACDPPQGWWTYSVTLATAPVAGRVSTFTVCGQNIHYYRLDFLDLNVTSASGINASFPDNTRVSYIAKNCFNADFEIPQGHKDVEINFILNANNFPGVGCANVTLHLEERNFLGQYLSYDS